MRPRTSRLNARGTQHMSTTRRATPFALLALTLAVAHTTAAPPAAQGEPEWAAAERDALRNHVRLTNPDDFIKAGEAYFDPDGRWIVFQAIPQPNAGEEASEHYAMYVARLLRDDRGGVTGIGEPIRISPTGSANTCGYFHPTRPYQVIFASTITPPRADEQQPGYQRDTGRYVWPFHHEMNVHSATVPEIFDDYLPGVPDAPPRQLSTLISREGYTAECAYSRSGHQIVYTQVDPETQDADIYIYNARNRRHHKIVSADGYDGGPFFSPDDRSIVYRSDRNSDGRLQVFIGLLELDARGEAVGLREERQVTSNEHVNWAPFWHPSGKFIAYTTSEISHRQYEIFTVQAPLSDHADAAPEELKRRRITHSEGFDGLPVFSNDAQHMMWTSQRRHPNDPADTPPSSQVWIAEIINVAP
ncbi:MAG: hypothetical protein EA379_00325 [Phycisphaerales bacterium]|nr:MAG: hypothetical protein EA379_00325 [Phycisphaerales bacterium]